MIRRAWSHIIRKNFKNMNQGLLIGIIDHVYIVKAASKFGLFLSVQRAAWRDCLSPSSTCEPARVILCLHSALLTSLMMTQTDTSDFDLAWLVVLVLGLGFGKDSRHHDLDACLLPTNHQFVPLKAQMIEHDGKFAC
jgi:hypothetical protein